MISTRQKGLIPYFLSAFMALLLLALSTVGTMPWFDEIVLTDKPANLILRGENYGYVYNLAYNVVFQGGLSLWFKAFGVSHFSTCAFTDLFALLASIALLRILSRRRILVSLPGQIVFTLLFWCGWNMSWIVTNGRSDTMTMLFTILLADALIPDNAEERQLHAGRILATSMLLMATSPCTLPVLATLGLVLLFCVPNGQRKTIVLRGILVAIGLGAAFCIMASVCAAVKGLLMFLSDYYSHNHATNAAGHSTLSVIATAYLIDLHPLAILAVAALLTLFTSKKRDVTLWLAIAFCALIPMIMAPIRYAMYYSWAFYLPAVIILAFALETARKQVLTTLVAVAALSMLTYKEFTNYTGSAERRQLYASCEKLVTENADRFKPGDDVVITEDLHELCGGFYYPVLNRQCRYWVRGPHVLSIPDDRTRFIGYLTGALSNRKIVDTLLSFQRFPPKLPNRGTFLFVSERRRTEILPLLAELGYREITAPRPANQYPCFSTWESIR